MVEVLIYLGWLAYAALEGMREGMYWYLKNTAEDDLVINEHILWTVQRTIVLLLVFLATNDVLLVCIFPFAFPFFHDGIYYSTRNLYDCRVYKKGWLDQSTTSTAFLTKFFTPWARTICFVLSVVLLTLYVL